MRGEVRTVWTPSHQLRTVLHVSAGREKEQGTGLPESGHDEVHQPAALTQPHLLHLVLTDLGPAVPAKRELVVSR